MRPAGEKRLKMAVNAGVYIYRNLRQSLMLAVEFDLPGRNLTCKYVKRLYANVAGGVCDNVCPSNSASP